MSTSAQSPSSSAESAPSLVEIVEQVNRGGDVPVESLSVYQQSDNAAERFLAHHAGATLGLRQCHTHLRDALESIGFSDRRVLEQFVGLSAFIGREQDAAAPTVAFGRSAISRGEVALGIEAAAAAAAQDLGRGGIWASARENLVELAELFGDAAIAEPWTGGGEWSNDRPHVGYLTSALGDDEPAARAAAAFAAHADPKQIKLSAYATEAYVRREGQHWAGFGDATPASRRPAASHNANAWINFGRGAVPSAKRGSQVLSRLRDAGSGTWIAPTDGDVLSAARALADRIVADQTDVLIVDADAVDPIAALVVAWRAAGKVLWIARRAPLYATGVDAVCYLDSAAATNDADFWGERDIPTQTLLEGVDLKATHGQPPARRQYGIPDQAVICATAATDVNQAIGPAMRQSIIELLRRQTQAVYLVVGGGDTTSLRRTFESAGVGRRVGYAGPRRDLAGFLAMADIYLVPFQAGVPAASEILTAMGAGLPLVAHADADAADITGSDAIADDNEAWLDQTAKLVRERNARRDLGAKMLRRVEKQYSFETTAKAISKQALGLVTNSGESESIKIDESTTTSKKPARAAA
ncbi:MAG: glycosyltransferase [Planctomycetota bacterium]